MTSAARHFRLLFFGSLTLFVVVLLSVTGYSIWRLHGEAMRNGLDKATSYTRNTEDFLTQSLHVTELAAAQALPSNDAALDLPAIARSFTATLEHAPFLRSISLLDTQGRIITSTNPANVGMLIATQHYLPATVEQQTILRIGGPWMGRDFARGRPISAASPVPGETLTFVPVTYTLVLGERALSLVVALNPDYFLNHISQMMDAAEGSVEVLRFDGTHLMDTQPEAAVGGLYDKVLQALGLPEVESGAFEHVSKNQQATLTAFRASRLYPFVVLTHLDREQALQSWRREAATLLGVVTSVLLLTIALAVMYYRRQIINAAQRAEAASARRISATVFDASAEAITITDIDANILSVNPAFTRMSGYSAAEVVGRNPRLMTSGLQSKAFYTHLWSELLEHGSWQGEMVNRHKDGRLFNVQVSITTSRDSLGQARHFIGVSTDITARKQAEAAALRSTQLLIEATEEAQAANLAKSRFLATMSHEIRTPMNGILGMAQLLQMHDTQEADRADYVNTILTSGQSLLALLNDILDLSKIESGKFQLDQAEFSPLQLMHDAQALFAGSAKAKKLGLEVHWRGTGGQCYRTDPHRLGQMLANLLGNAIKFTPQGHIRLEGTEVERLGDATVLEFSVSDTGIGIAPDKLKLLFLPFSQTDNSTTREFGGSGLGLSIVSSLARMLGGGVGVESTPGQGSRFWFRIRAELCARPDTALPAPTATPPTASYLNGRVLVAEDNPVNAMVIQALLGRLGLTATVVGNGRQALSAITQGAAPDVVLMDLQMPEMDGLTATRQIRQFENEHAQPRVPIIALTADAFAEDRQHCLAAGMDDYLSKPIALDALILALAPFLEKCPDTPPAPKPPAPTGQTFNRARLEFLVQEITPMLAFNRFDALEQFKEIVQLVANTDLAPEVARIEITLKTFRFDLALTQLQALVTMQAEKDQQ